MRRLPPPRKLFAKKGLWDSLSLLDAALAHQGRDAETREAVVRLLELEHNFRISEWIDRICHWRAGLLVDGLRKAGLPYRGTCDLIKKTVTSVIGHFSDVAARADDVGSLG